MISQRWNPWRALRHRPEIELRFADLGGPQGLWQRDALGDLVVLDVSLDRRERRCVLAHELIHAERGIGRPAASLATMEREEEQVRREVARRLVPLDELTALRARGDDVPMSLEDLADHFDVVPAVMAVAVGLLENEPRPAT